MRQTHLWILILWLCEPVCLPAWAWAITPDDVTTSLKVIPLLNNKPVRTAMAAIIYNPVNTQSLEEAKAIQQLIDGGLEAPGGIKLSSVLVSSKNPAGLSGASIAYLTDGLSGVDLETVGRATAGSGILTISTDLNYVKAKQCVIAVISSPSVKIYYSQAAADAGRVSFSQGFAMLADHI